MTGRTNASATTQDRPVVTVLGPGQMGLVCAGLLASIPTQSNPEPGTISRPVHVQLWGHSKEEVDEVARTRRSPRLPEFTLPESVEVLHHDDAISRSSLIVSAVPVQVTREAWTRLAPYVPPTASVVSVAKGIENTTLLRPTQLIADALRLAGRANKDRSYACLSGPTIAAELARSLPAAMVAASSDARFARELQGLFNNSWMRIYTNSDLTGVELAGAAKNVIAIAAGIMDGLNAGNNAKSLLLSRGLAEIVRLGTAMGANPETFFGIAGVGDLATTCFSPEGRNRSCGEALGRGEKLDAYLHRTMHIVEGVATTRSVVALAEKHAVEMPITRGVHAVLFEKLDPRIAISRLMSREMKAEKVG